MYTKHKWQSAVHFNFGYTQYLPPDFDPSKKYPLVFFLHGAGEWGDDLDVACTNGFMKHVRQGKEYPFICVAPQCPAHHYWANFTESLLAFLDYICETLPIDQDRIYLTGLSMGGTGTWMLAMAAPQRFAAIAPVCGTGVYWHAHSIKHLPIRIYHGDLDETVPLSESVSMLTSINLKGGHAELVIFYGVAHNAWDPAYEGDEMVNWLLSHKRGE